MSVSVSGGTLTVSEISGSAGNALVLMGQEAQLNITRQNTLDVTAIAQVALQTAQLIAYYQLHDDAVDLRDQKIDAQIAFQDKLTAYKFGADLNMLNLKKSVLTDLNLPSVDMCSDAVNLSSEAVGDGAAVVAKSQDLAQESCGGVPQGWGTHDGTLYAAKAGSYVGGVLSNSARRDEESFRQTKTDLVRAGQQGMKAVFKSDTVLAKYAQAASIHSGLADLFLQGFNSAGSALGATLGRFSGDSSPTVGGVIQGGTSGLDTVG